MPWPGRRMGNLSRHRAAMDMSAATMSSSAAGRSTKNRDAWRSPPAASGSCSAPPGICASSARTARRSGRSPWMCPWAINRSGDGRIAVGANIQAAHIRTLAFDSSLEFRTWACERMHRERTAVHPPRSQVGPQDRRPGCFRPQAWQRVPTACSTKGARKTTVKRGELCIGMLHDMLEGPGVDPGDF